MAHEFDPTDPRPAWHEAGIAGLAQACADHHEAGLRAYLAGGPTSRQEIVDEVHAYVAEMIDDLDPTYQPTCDLLLDRLAESGDLPTAPMVAALWPIIDDEDTGEVLRDALVKVSAVYGLVFPDDELVEGWNVSDALDLLAESDNVLMTDELQAQIRLVRTVAS